MGEDFYEEEPLSSMWPQDIEDKSNKQFTIEKPNQSGEILLKEINFKEDQHKMDFRKLTELTDYSDIGSHQLSSLVKQYKNSKQNAVRLLHEEINSLNKQRIEIEQKELEILREHRFVEKNQISVLDDELCELNRSKINSNCENNLILYEKKFEEEIEEERDVLYWREKTEQLERSLKKSLKRERLLEQKLKDSVRVLEEQKSPVEELSRILKRADNFLHFILQNSPVVIAHQDTELRYRFIYNHFPSLGEDDIIGKTDEEILSGDGVREFSNFKREVLENGKPAKREITYETPLFGKKTFLTYVEPVFNKKREIIGINYIGLEVSDQVKKRERLAKNREELAVQMAKETELSKNIVITEETMRAKQMLATMSHEIRSPLTGVVSMAEILANTKLDKEQRQLLDVMLSSGDLVLQLINDILDLSKAESGVMRLEETKFRPREVVKHALQTAAASLKKELILEGHISNDVPLEVMGDVLRIRQIFTNLISNAVKFTHEGKVGIKLRVVSEPESNNKLKQENNSSVLKSKENNSSVLNSSENLCEGENSCSCKEEKIVWLQCDVYDTGIGIPENAIPTLFTRYMQASTDHARKYGGTGLGLAICKQLVEELMEGKIHVSSKEHEGSKFTFTIPCKIPPKIEISDDSDDSSAVSCSAPAPNPVSADVMQGFFLFKPKLKIVHRRKPSSSLPSSPLASPVCPEDSNSNLGHSNSGSNLGHSNSSSNLGHSNNLSSNSNSNNLSSNLEHSNSSSNLGHSNPSSNLGDLNNLSSNLGNSSSNSGNSNNSSSNLGNSSSFLGNSNNLSSNSGNSNNLSSNSNLLVGEGFRVLLVEDNKVNIIVARNMLSQLGHKVDIVNNGLDAIRAVQKTQYDLIFMDVNMPVMDGIQATRLIRSFEETGIWDPSVGPTCQIISEELSKRTPIIAMTANAYGESAPECLASGMDSYVSKPITFQNLKQVLQNFSPCKT